jgi:hypothetical protein
MLLLLLFDFNKTECAGILVKLPNTKFPENAFSSFVVACGRSDRRGESNGHLFATSLAKGPKKHE